MFYKFGNPHGMPTFKIEVLCIVSKYHWLNSFCRVMNGKYSVTLLFIGSNSQCALLLRLRQSIVSIASAYKETEISRTCLIGYSGFISCEWFLIAWGEDTHTHAHTDFPDKSNFKNPGAHIKTAQL